MRLSGPNYMDNFLFFFVYPPRNNTNQSWFLAVIIESERRNESRVGALQTFIVKIFLIIIVLIIGWFFVRELNGFFDQAFVYTYSPHNNRRGSRFFFYYQFSYRRIQTYKWSTGHGTQFFRVWLRTVSISVLTNNIIKKKPQFKLCNKKKKNRVIINNIKNYMIKNIVGKYNQHVLIARLSFPGHDFFAQSAAKGIGTNYMF